MIAEQHGGATNADRLAYACWRCNRHKGTDLGSFDPQTGAFSFLFNPRTQQWTEHFRFLAPTIVGLTPQGRTTANLLQFNSNERLAERQQMFSNGNGKKIC
ncbi:MAG: HNH endonuclease [Hormoscilla sp. GM7CHS1pb]|nr:HNH endonuclease [Hormoscilla sp. GM7CHS1pb]